MGRTNDEMLILKQAYFDMYQEDLGVAIAGDLSNDFEKIMKTVVQVLYPYI